MLLMSNQPLNRMCAQRKNSSMCCVHERVRKNTYIWLSRIDQSKLSSLFCQQKWRFWTFVRSDAPWRWRRFSVWRAMKALINQMIKSSYSEHSKNSHVDKQASRFVQNKSTLFALWTCRTEVTIIIIIVIIAHRPVCNAYNASDTLKSWRRTKINRQTQKQIHSIRCIVARGIGLAFQRAAIGLSRFYQWIERLCAQRKQTEFGSAVRAGWRADNDDVHINRRLEIHSRRPAKPSGLLMTSDRTSLQPHIGSNSSSI